MQRLLRTIGVASLGLAVGLGLGFGAGCGEKEKESSKSGESTSGGDRSSNAGGGGDAAAVGTWVLDKDNIREVMRAMITEQMGGSIPPEAAPMVEQQVNQMIDRMEMRLELNADGTASMNAVNPMDGSRKEDNGTWTRDGDTITISTAGEDPELGPGTVKGKLVNGALEMTAPGNEEMTLRLIRGG